MVTKYDHTQLKKGDLAVYGSRYGFGGSSWRVSKSKVDRLTTTEIVLEDGQRFRRKDGQKVGGDLDQVTMLLDPKGVEARNAVGEMLALKIGHSVWEWDKIRRNVRTLESWEVSLAHLEAVAAQARRELNEYKKEWE